MTNRSYKLLASILPLILLCAAPVFARTKTSLNNGWRFLKADVSNAQAVGFGDSSWRAVDIPHTWNLDDPWDDEPGYHRGAAWYRRELMLPNASAGTRLFLFFEGANQVADVYVNGEKAGTHIGGYSAFAFDITGMARPGRNLIAVRVDNSFNEDIPPLTADFNFYGGIYRDVWLIATQDVHFTVTDHASPGVRITTPKIAKGDGAVAIDGTITNSGERTRNIELVTTILDAANRKVAGTTSRLQVEPGRDTRFAHSTVVKSPKLWSPDSPYLYKVRISIREVGRIVDEVIQPLGFRWFKFDGQTGFSLNGRPMRLVGANRHQDYAGLGNAVPDRLHAQDMKILKDAGFNFVRLAHYPQDPSVLEACDRLGLLVWEETPIVNYITKSAAFSANSATMVREMIRQHRNHPSMLLWGYMNEIFLRTPAGRDDLYPATAQLARELDRIAKEEDPTRPTTIAFHGSDIYNKHGLGEIPDVIGWNLYQGWYSATVDDFGKFIDDQHKRFPSRPLIISEYGANGDRRLHSSSPRRFDSTIDYQRFYHESYFAQMRSRPFIAGSALWNEFDFGSELRGETIPHLNQKGMYTFDRKPKDIHFFYKAQVSKESVLHIAVRDSLKRAGPDGEKQTIEVYSNLDSVELSLDGRSLGRKRVDAGRKVIWEVLLRTGANRLTASGAKGKAFVTDSATMVFDAVSVNSNEIAINVGSNADFVDSTGLVWIADKEYSRGSWGYVGEKAKRIFSQPPDPNVRGTLSDPLLQSMVEGLSEYRIDVPDGYYDVELFFVEMKLDQVGKRTFDLQVNGTTIIEGLDIARAVGSRHFFSRKFQTQVKNGLSIGFVARTGEPVLSAIRVARKRAPLPRNS